jgi:hypothetical protein
MPSCELSALVDRHFELTILPSEERQLRAHLPGCATCRERYERRLLLSQVMPNAASAQERIGSGLGFERRSSRADRRWWLLVAVPLAAALAVVLRSPVTDGDDFAARGADAGPLALIEIYRFPVSGGSSKVAREIAGTDALAFAYRNPAGRKYLVVFAVDSAGAVRWYAPGWTDPALTPSAVPIATGHQLRELSTAIAHPLPPGRLTVHAVFADGSATVREVEAALSDGGVPVGTDHLVFELEVKP